MAEGRRPRIYTIPAHRAFADALVAGSAVFKGGPSAYAGNIEAIRKAAEAARGDWV